MKNILKSIKSSLNGLRVYVDKVVTKATKGLATDKSVKDVQTVAKEAKSTADNAVDLALNAQTAADSRPQHLDCGELEIDTIERDTMEINKPVVCEITNAKTLKANMKKMNSDGDTVSVYFYAKHVTTATLSSQFVALLSRRVNRGYASPVFAGTISIPFYLSKYNEYSQPDAFETYYVELMYGSAYDETITVSITRIS